jgi:hypothetical protein
MNRNHKKAKQNEQTMRVWTYVQAKQALPFLASVVGSVRDHRIEALRHDLHARRLAKQPGRPDRKALIAHEEALRGARQANDRFQQALDELHDLGIYCLDPIRGEALVPFVREQQLAWFIYELFDQEPFRFWRYHTDALETRRPIAEALEGPVEPPLVV